MTSSPIGGPHRAPPADAAGEVTRPAAPLPPDLSPELPPGPASVTLRLGYREPLPYRESVAFLAGRCVPGVEEVEGDTYRRVLRLAHGTGVVGISPDVPAGSDGGPAIVCRLDLEDGRDAGEAVAGCRRLLDLDADPGAVDAALGSDALLGPVVAAGPGRRAPGHVDGHELAFRAVLGQQVSVAAARALAGRVAARHGRPLASSRGGLTVAFPTAAALAEGDLDGIGLTTARRDTLRRLANALAEGRVDLRPGADPAETERALRRLAGIGPWTAAYVRMRALDDADTFLPTDLGVRRALERLGRDGRPRAAATLARRWAPWRSYAVQYLWSTLP